MVAAGLVGAFSIFFSNKDTKNLQKGWKPGNGRQQQQLAACRKLLFETLKKTKRPRNQPCCHHSHITESGFYRPPPIRNTKTTPFFVLQEHTRWLQRGVQLWTQANRPQLLKVGLALLVIVRGVEVLARCSYRIVNCPAGEIGRRVFLEKAFVR